MSTSDRVSQSCRHGAANRCRQRWRRSRRRRPGAGGASSQVTGPLRRRVLPLESVGGWKRVEGPLRSPTVTTGRARPGWSRSSRAPTPVPRKSSSFVQTPADKASAVATTGQSEGSRKDRGRGAAGCSRSAKVTRSASPTPRGRGGHPRRLPRPRLAVGAVGQPLDANEHGRRGCHLAAEVGAEAGGAGADELGELALGHPGPGDGRPNAGQRPGLGPPARHRHGRRRRPCGRAARRHRALARRCGARRQPPGPTSARRISARIRLPVGNEPAIDRRDERFERPGPDVVSGAGVDVRNWSAITRLLQPQSELLAHGDDVGPAVPGRERLVAGQLGDHIRVPRRRIRRP